MRYYSIDYFMKSQIIIFLLFFAVIINGYAQLSPTLNFNYRLHHGDKSVFLEVYSYLNSDKIVPEFASFNGLGEGVGENATEKHVTNYALYRNCLFTKDELDMTGDITPEAYSCFVKKYYDKIYYSNLAEAFLISPLENRTASLQFRSITNQRNKAINDNRNFLINYSCEVNKEILDLINIHDPKCLLLITSEFYKATKTFRYNEENLSDLLTLLTKTEIGVVTPQYTNWHIEKGSYYNEPLTQLIYFSKNYSSYSWNNNTGIFENINNIIAPVDSERILFEHLSNQNDSIANSAFLRLIDGNPSKIVDLVNEYQLSNIPTNNSLLYPPYYRLEVLNNFVNYCKLSKKHYLSDPIFSPIINQLKSNLSLMDRRTLENKIIKNITLKNINSLEYEKILIAHGDEGDCASIGRCLDVFYSKNFNKILNNENELKLFLIKGILFKNNINENYLLIFTGLKDAISKLNAIKTNDTNIISAISIAKNYCHQSQPIPFDSNKTSKYNYDYQINNLNEMFQNILNIQDNKLLTDSLLHTIQKVNYSQIAETFATIEKAKISEYYRKTDIFEFIYSSFGIFYYDVNDSIGRKIFLNDYHTFSEIDFYKNMLKKSQIDYTNQKGKLDYSKIYNILKYNNNICLFETNECYALIKILELTHKTTLGYPIKLCNSSYGSISCSVQNRIDSWMFFIKENYLKRKKQNEPISLFTNNIYR